jgi:ATP-binding cassette subfamily B protein
VAREQQQPPEPAFTKALGYLNSNSSTVWLAHLSAIGSALVFVGLLSILFLFIDYLDWRGRIPRYRELSPHQQNILKSRWASATEEGRKEWWDAALAPVESDKGKAPSVPDDQLSPEEADHVWTGMLRLTLRARCGEEAVEDVFVVDKASPAYYTISSEDWGILSLAARSELRVLPSLVPYLAGWNQWAWNRSMQLSEGEDEAEQSLLSRAFPPYLAGMALMTIVLGLLGTFFIILNREMAAQAATEASGRLRRAVYHHTFRLGQLAIRALGPTEAVTILTRHIEALHDAFFARLTVYFREPIYLVTLVLFAVVTEPALALSFMLFALIVYGVGVQLIGYFRARSKLASTVAAERLTVIRESLMLMRLVKVYMMEQFNQGRIERQLSKYGSVQRLRHRADELALPLLALFGGACVLVLLYVGALMVLYAGLPLAGGCVLAATLLLLYWPFDRWLETRTVMRRGHESAEQIFNFLDKRGDVGQVVGAEFLQPMNKVLEFDNVTLRDPSGNRVLLEDVSLSISAGQRVALVGADELEKQAIVYLLPRLLDPTAGEIRIDSRNLRWVTLESLRTQIGIVMMHNLVFHDTVRNNIGCGDQTYSTPQIIEAAKMAHAHHFIQKLPQGYDTPIGEMGHSLTLSEKYRIALARAILRDPALLIIEEPSVELDDESKDLLDDTLSRMLPDRTTIFLPHRISTLKACNKIYLLNKGRVVANGTHKELLAANKLYRHLHYLEFNAMDEAQPSENRDRARSEA